MVVNIIFIVCGLGLLGYGIYLQLTMDNYSALLGVENINPGTIIIIGGSIMIILGFFGCCGAWQKDNGCGTCMLRTFGSLSALLLLIEVVFVLVVYFFGVLLCNFITGWLWLVLLYNWLLVLGLLV